jgi:AAA+ ATPase superfamily predicted ATPase
MLLPMKLKFLNRAKEAARIRTALSERLPVLVVIYGRRRCGKSTLLQHTMGTDCVYFLADQRDASAQIAALTQEIGRVVAGFGEGNYVSWDALIRGLNVRMDKGLTVCLDEFPYLVQSSPELPCLIQRYIDSPGEKRLNWVLCGSSQRMMQGLVLDRTAPLYGRASEVLRIEPLDFGWVADALNVRGVDGIRHFAVWGGVPRYWELAATYKSLDSAITGLVLDPMGALHDEPVRLLLDDMRTTVQANSLLSLIGNGCSRLSELGARLGKPAGSLVRPLGNLVDLGYVCREVPFGETPKSTRKTLYRLADPFLDFQYRFVIPNRSILQQGAVDAVWRRTLKAFDSYVGEVWERLARLSVARLPIDGVEWNLASRWWGEVGKQRSEYDIVAESFDGRELLVGEAKLHLRPGECIAANKSLREKASRLPFVAGRRVHSVLWVASGVSAGQFADVITTDDVASVMR